MDRPDGLLGQATNSIARLNEDNLSRAGELEELPYPPFDIAEVPDGKMLVARVVTPGPSVALLNNIVLAEAKIEANKLSFPSLSKVTWYAGSTDPTVLLDHSKPIPVANGIEAIIANSVTLGGDVSLAQLISELTSDTMLVFAYKCSPDCEVDHAYVFLRKEALEVFWIFAELVGDFNRVLSPRWFVALQGDVLEQLTPGKIVLKDEQTQKLTLTVCNDPPDSVEEEQVVVLSINFDAHFVCFDNNGIKVMAMKDGERITDSGGLTSVRWYLGNKVDVPPWNMLEDLMKILASADRDRVTVSY